MTGGSIGIMQVHRMLKNHCKDINKDLLEACKELLQVCQDCGFGTEPKSFDGWLEYDHERDKMMALEKRAIEAIVKAEQK